MTSFGLSNEVFAAAGSEYTPTQPNAFASYSNATNQVQVSWDFDAMTPGDKCLIKMDIDYQSRATHDYVPIQKISHYIPDYYSAISSSPTLIGNDGSYAEEVDCEDASLRIDLDTIMNDPLNIHGLDNLMIYLTFYATDDLTSYSLSDSNRIDEVFVVYSPNEVLVDGGANDQIQWACDSQIGSVLYIDPSGSGDSIIAHGNNGDNCGDYVYIENNQYVDIGMAGAVAPLLPDGDKFYDTHDESSFSLLTLVRLSTSDSGGCNDCIDSTFYYSQHRIIVENGFVYNGYSTDVTDTHTETPPLTTSVNQTNIMKLKVYDNFGTDAIKWVDVGFGLPGLKSSFDKAEVTIEIRLDNNVVKELKIHDPHNLVDFGDITSNVVDCGYVEENCLQVTIPHSFNDKLINDIIGVKASDYEPNKKIHYFNEGIHIEGTPDMPLTDKIFVQKYLGNPDFEWVDIVRVDRSDDIWASEDGLEFTSSHGGGYLRITPLDIDPNLV